VRVNGALRCACHVHVHVHEHEHEHVHVHVCMCMCRCMDRSKQSSMWGGGVKCEVCRKVRESVAETAGCLILAVLEGGRGR